MKASLCALLFLVSACGGSDEKEYGDPVTVDPSTKSGLTSAISSAAALASVESNPSNDATLGNVSSLYTAFAVLSPACQVNARKPEPAELALDALSKPIDETCVTVTTGKVTYNNCNYGSGSINGFISYGGGTFTTDIKITVSVSGSSTTVTEKGVMNVSATAIKGNMTVSTNGSFGGTTVKATYSSTFDVMLTSSCATGGKVEVSISGTASGQGGSGSYDFGAKAEFGPACGDVKLYCAK